MSSLPGRRGAARQGGYVNVLATRAGWKGRRRIPRLLPGAAAGRMLASRNTRGEKLKSSVFGKSPYQASFIIRRTGRRWVASLPVVSLSNVPPGSAAGTFVFLFLKPASAGTGSKKGTGNGRSCGAER